MFFISVSPHTDAYSNPPTPKLSLTPGTTWAVLYAAVKKFESQQFKKWESQLPSVFGALWVASIVKAEMDDAEADKKIEVEMDDADTDEADEADTVVGSDVATTEIQVESDVEIQKLEQDVERLFRDNS
jgi:hypothetical protein